MFDDVALQRGANTVTATGDHGGQAVTDEVAWSYDRGSISISAGQVWTGYVASTGARFGSDHFFTGGRGLFYELGDDAGGGVPDDIEGTDDPTLYKFFRSGEFAYEIPLADGSYDVTLGFMEPDEDVDEGDRVFDVTANEEPVLEGFDVLAEAGDRLTAVTETFTVQVIGGQLVLEFQPTQGEAMVSYLAIEMTGGESEEPTPAPSESG